MNRQLVAILTFGVLACLFFGLMAGYLADKNPRLHAKVALEQTFPVRVASVRDVAPQPGAGRTLDIEARLREGASPPPDVAFAMATLAYASFTQPGVQRVAFQSIVVRLEGRAPDTFSVAAVARRLALQQVLDEASPTIVERLGEGTRLSVIAEGPMRVGVAVTPGRPGIPPPEAAAAVMQPTAYQFRFVRVDSGAPGGAHVIEAKDVPRGR